MAPQIVFLHLQKTAGTTLHNLLYPLFKPSEVAPAYLGDFGPLKSGSYRYIYGHLPYAAARLHFPNATYVTMLRDPIARLVSQFRSFKKRENFSEAWRSTRTARQIEAIEFCWNATFAEFLRSDHENIVGHTQNLYVAMLSSPEDPDRLESAKRNLSAFACVGIQEMWRTSLQMIFEKIGAPLPANALAEHLNKSEPFEAELTDETLPLVYAKVKDDLALYRWAVPRFDEQVAAVRERDRADGAVTSR